MPPGADRRRSSHYDDDILEKYLDDEEITADDLQPAICARPPSTTSVVPVLTGSAFKNKGVQPLLDAVVDYLPSPARPARRSRA